MSFDPVNNPIDYVEVAGQRSPGIAVVSGADLEADIQERRAFGFGGARAVYRGKKVTHFQVTFTLESTPERNDWPAWHAFREILGRPPTGRRARALDIWHPILEDAGIRQVLVEGVGQPVPDDTGGWAITVKFAEYKRPRRALATPDGADAQNLTPGERAIQAQAAENENLGRQRDALAADL